MPALLIRMSGDPRSARTDAKNAVTDASSEMAQRCAKPATPSARMALSVSCAASSRSRYEMATDAPRSASATAIARPIPRDPPVTTATRPFRLDSSIRYLLSRRRSRSGRRICADHDAVDRPAARDGVDEEGSGADGLRPFADQHLQRRIAV